MRLSLILLFSIFLVACNNNDDVEKTIDNLANAESTIKNDFPTSKEVFDYAQSEFDNLTNFGENYVPEEHDELVIQLTADHFELDYDKTYNLYIDGATSLSSNTSLYTKTSNETSNVMTMELYKLLQPNMTYDEVTSLVKAEGTLNPSISQNGIASYKFDAVSHASVTLVFFDDKLASTSQAGLVDTPEIPFEKYNQLVKGMSISEVFSLIGEGEYIGFLNSPNSDLITSYTYLVNNSYMQLNFSGNSLYTIPTPY